MKKLILVGSLVSLSISVSGCSAGESSKTANIQSSHETVTENQTKDFLKPSTSNKKIAEKNQSNQNVKESGINQQLNDVDNLMNGLNETEDNLKID